MPRTGITLRPVTRADLSAVAAIYNDYVIHSTCTFATEPEGPEFWEAWLTEHVGPHPAIVAVDDAEVAGWGSLSAWHTRCAYRFSVEDSVYVERSRQGRGIGRAMLEELLRLARRHGHRSVLAQIAEGQPVSDAIHERLGFRRVGSLQDVGFKFDRWISVSIWQRMLPAAPDARKPLAD
jgi:phosphinothricin acetyltransferase